MTQLIHPNFTRGWDVVLSALSRGSKPDWLRYFIQNHSPSPMLLLFATVTLVAAAYLENVHSAFAALPIFRWMRLRRGPILFRITFTLGYYPNTIFYRRGVWDSRKAVNTSVK